MAQLLADLAKSGMTAAPNPTLETRAMMVTTPGINVLGQRGAGGTIAITQPGESLVRAEGDRMNLAKRCNPLADNYFGDLGGIDAKVRR